MLFTFGALVDLVGEDVFGEGKSDRVVEAGQQLSERLVSPSYEHRDGGMLVCGGGYAADRVDDADSDVTILDEAGEVGQKKRDLVSIAGWFRTLL